MRVLPALGVAQQFLRRHEQARVAARRETPSFLRQVLYAFVLGSVFYAIRRISGTIIVPMVIHALWDFGTFSTVAGKPTGAATAGMNLAMAGLGMIGRLLVLAAIICVIIGTMRILATKKRPRSRPARSDLR